MSRDNRDMRDPLEVGERYLELRGRGAPIDVAVLVPAKKWTGDGFMSSNPADHHSKTPQTIEVGEPGGD